MSYRNKTYVVFDGQKDIWAYRYMKGWKSLQNVDFNFHDAHDLGSELTPRASEVTVKARLRQRFSSAKQVVVLIGESTRYKYRFVRWELDVALDLDLPMVAVNLDERRRIDPERCPPIIRDEYVVHVPFKMAIIKFALDHFPDEYARRNRNATGPRCYKEDVYEELGLLEGPRQATRPTTSRPPIPRPDQAASGIHALVGNDVPPSRIADAFNRFLAAAGVAAPNYFDIVRGLPKSEPKPRNLLLEALIRAKLPKP